MTRRRAPALALAVLATSMGCDAARDVAPPPADEAAESAPPAEREPTAERVHTAERVRTGERVPAADVGVAPENEASQQSGPADVRFDVQERPAKDVVEFLQQRTDVHLILTRAAEEVPVTLRVQDLTWRQALDRVVAAGGFYMEEHSKKLIRIDWVRATYDYDDADLRTVLMGMANASGASIVLGPEVKGRVTLSFRDVPWIVALRRIAAEGGFTVVEQSRGILRVADPANVDPSARSRTDARRDAGWEAMRSAADGAGAVSFDSWDRPLGELVGLIQEQTAVNLVVTDEARDETVAIELRRLPWPEALEVTAERAGCRLEARSPRLVVIDRVPRVSFSFEDADLRTVIGTIVKTSRTSIVVDPAVEGRVAAALRDVPWRSALESIAEAHGYAVSEEPHGILRLALPTSARETGARRGRDGRPPDAVPDGTPAVEPAVGIHVVKRPLREVVALIQVVTDVDLAFADDQAGDLPLSLTVRSLPWSEALALALERSGCAMQRTSRDRITIHRPPRVTARFENADVREVVETIADRAGADVSVDPGVVGTITMWLFDAPWRAALEATAASLDLAVVAGPRGGLRVGAAARPGDDGRER